MAFQFPDDPAANPEVTLGNVTYKWDGEKWVAEPAGTTAPDLQAVTDEGSTTTNFIQIGNVTDPALSGHFFGAGGGCEHHVRGDATPETPTLSLYRGNDLNFSVRANGSATFKGDIDADNYRIDQLPSITTA